jgi:hypothetical protein
MSRWTIGETEIESSWPSGSCNKSSAPKTTASTVSDAQPAPCQPPPTSSTTTRTAHTSWPTIRHAMPAPPYSRSKASTHHQRRPLRRRARAAVPIRQRIPPLRRHATPPQRTTSRSVGITLSCCRTVSASATGPHVRDRWTGCALGRTRAASCHSSRGSARRTSFGQDERQDASNDDRGVMATVPPPPRGVARRPGQP